MWVQPQLQAPGVTRRVLLGSLAALLTGCSGSGPEQVTGALPRRLVRFPGKDALYLLTDRPPQLETPVKYFAHDLTPNSAFFVRWHLSGVPTSVDLQSFRLHVKGHVGRNLSLTVDELRRRFEPVSVVALNQCSGNSRGLFEPRVTGGQWGHGAMGNARWTGVRLRDLLHAAGIRSGAADVSFRGLDAAPAPGVPAYVKTLQLDKAQDEEVLVAYAMNDEPLPLLNGFPLRLVVPGWYATYWVKALTEIEVLAQPFQGFWMSKAYRIPNNPNGIEAPDQLAQDLVPITRICIHSIFVKPESGERLPVGKAIELEGVATDGGGDINLVEVSTDGGANWEPAALDASLGRYSWRRWRHSWTPPRAGAYTLMVRASNAAGETQQQHHWNRSGYMRQVVESIQVKAG